MDEILNKLKKDMDHFQLTLQGLSSGVSQASSLWQDAKYHEISASLRTISLMSRTILESGGKCCSSISKFSSIAGEEY